MAKFTWLVNRDRTVQDWREERLQCLGPKPVGVGKYKEGLRALQRPRGQRPAPDLARLEVARWGTCAQKLGINWLTNSARVWWGGGTRELATGEIRDLRAPRSGYSEYHTPHLQAFWDQPPPSTTGQGFWNRQRCKKVSRFFQTSDTTGVGNRGNDLEHH